MVLHCIGLLLYQCFIAPYRYILHDCYSSSFCIYIVIYCNMELDKSKVTYVTMWMDNKWNENFCYLTFLPIVWIINSIVEAKKFPRVSKETNILVELGTPCIKDKLKQHRWTLWAQLQDIHYMIIKTIMINRFKHIQFK
jgi:hypothetical protein